MTELGHHHTRVPVVGVNVIEYEGVNVLLDIWALMLLV